MAKTSSNSLTLKPIATGFLVSHEDGDHHAFPSLSDAMGHVEGQFAPKVKGAVKKPAPSSVASAKKVPTAKPAVSADKPTPAAKPATPTRPSRPRPAAEPAAPAKKAATSASAISAIKP